MRPLAEALDRWGLGHARAALVAARENSVYRVETPEGAVTALRFRRPGYRTPAQMRSELDMMACLSAAGLRVPAPIAAGSGAQLEQVAGFDVDMLEWVAGTPFHQIALAGRAGAFAELGRAAARAHTAFDTWTLPTGFTRPAWDRNGLIGETPLWGRFWEHPHLSPPQRDLIQSARADIARQVDASAHMLDYGLIHADLVGENVLMSPAGPALIDFDDAGFGFRLFELATILQHQMDAPDYREIAAAVLDGYRQIRRVDTDLLNLMILARSFTYLGWIMSRLDEPGGREKSERFITRSTRRAAQWLDGQELT